MYRMCIIPQTIWLPAAYLIGNGNLLYFLPILIRKLEKQGFIYYSLTMTSKAEKPNMS
jgi:hypothetical protein